jgi:uncharacterized membrane protein YoaT (DUF817 family)
LSVAIYVNFFAHHYIPDMHLFIAAAVLFARTRVYFVNWRTPRWMPLLLGLILVTAFIWFSENVGTFTKTWLYPNQRSGWSLVSAGKFGSWFLLLIISYTLVALIKKPSERAMPAPARSHEEEDAPALAEAVEPPPQGAFVPR